MTSKPLLAPLRDALRRVANPAKAAQMQAYMKSQMPYLGVAMPVLRATCRERWRLLSWPDARAWQRDVLEVWRGAEFREERYAALMLCRHRAARAYQTPERLPLYEELIVTGAWWDLVDELAQHGVGELLRAHPKALKPQMRAWSRDDDLWKRRTSILCQNRFKAGTDLALLYACIEPSLDSKEFFLRKAIGWALREYAKTDPAEVKRYVRAKAGALSGLSRREALKNIGG